jgi:hypothetical protein
MSNLRNVLISFGAFWLSLLDRNMGFSGTSGNSRAKSFHADGALDTIALGVMTSMD